MKKILSVPLYSISSIDDFFHAFKSVQIWSLESVKGLFEFLEKNKLSVTFS